MIYEHLFFVSASENCYVYYYVVMYNEDTAELIIFYLRINVRQERLNAIGCTHVT